MTKLEWNKIVGIIFIVLSIISASLFLFGYIYLTQKPSHPDGNLYLKNGTGNLIDTIQVGHDKAVAICRNSILNCNDVAYGCGSFNCECVI